MTDEIDIKLPVSGKTVTIRNFTTRSDDEKAEDVLYFGVSTDETLSKDGSVEKRTKFPYANIMASQDVYVKRLVKSIDGDNKDLYSKLLDLRTDDYKAIQDAVEKITDTNSPKASEAESASTNSTL